MKHAAIIPLAGGAAIGASLALGKPPEYMASWDVFSKNDRYAKNYYQDVKFIRLDDKENKKKGVPKVDIITCVPPCSGLSTSTPSTARGCQAPQNQHMLKVAEKGMMGQTEVILIENAPTLYSRGGEPFAKRFIPLCKKYGYSMVLFLTSTILHGLPQNRKRSFVILYKGNRIPDWEEFAIKKDYTPLHKMKVELAAKSKLWKPEEDELIFVLQEKLKCRNNRDLLLKVAQLYHDKPVTAWKVFIDCKFKHRFKTAPYRYMQRTMEAGNGIMDRSPYLVWDHCNALMWKSAHKMINPAEPSRQLNIRELMNLMGLPKDYKEIPAKDINVLFQNVPVNTVKTIVEAIKKQLSNKGLWIKPTESITRFNNIKQQFETL